MQNTRGSAEAREWASARAGDFGRAVKHWRDKQGLSASALAQRTDEVGYPITRGAIAKIEGNHRGGKIDVAEVVTLAAALGVPPIELLYPGLPDSEVEGLPRQRVSSWEAAQWFSGEKSAESLVGLTRKRDEIRRKLRLNETAIRRQMAPEKIEELTEWVVLYEEQIVEIEQQIVDVGGVVDRG